MGEATRWCRRDDGMRGCSGEAEMTGGCSGGGVKFSARQKQPGFRYVCRRGGGPNKDRRRRRRRGEGDSVKGRQSDRRGGQSHWMRGRRVGVGVGGGREVANGGGRAIRRPAETSESTSESLHAQNELAAGGFSGRKGDPGVERASTARMRVSRRSSLSALGGCWAIPSWSDG